ncbi:MAG: hypothetical protein KF747_09410 [Nitrospira sp.]|nr:hypothetical protein [Nitrospira sp.]
MRLWVVPSDQEFARPTEDVGYLVQLLKIQVFIANHLMLSQNLLPAQSILVGCRTA